VISGAGVALKGERKGGGSDARVRGVSEVNDERASVHGEHGTG
jgi:hypothetical protein